MHDEPPRTSLASAVGWGFYLASSWTWVIGMYLPVLLVRDYGVGGWIVFAIPNVVGAAAMGWVLRSRETAGRIVADHGAAVTTFTAVTISFQLFALMWLLPTLVGTGGVLLVLAALVCAVSYPLARGLGIPLNAIAVWVLSAAVFLMLASGGVLEPPPPTGDDPPWHLVGLAPACLLGFLLCPYLDATFLHARYETDRAGARIAFTLGFGVLFLAMILFTLFYASPWSAGGFAGVAGWLLAAHLTAQVCFTVAAHSAVTRVSPATLLGIAAAAVLGLAALGGELADFRFLELGAGEIIYRGYMAFYGLFFPGYVLLVMICRADLRLYWLACFLALPFFALGFLAGLMPWTAGGVLILLAAAVVAKVRRVSVA